jgi:putative transposase
MSQSLQTKGRSTVPNYLTTDSLAAPNSHLPFRRRESAMLRFRRMRSLQNFAAVHSSVHNHFNRERHLSSRENFKMNRSAALAEWRELGAG